MDRIHELIQLPKIERLAIISALVNSLQKEAEVEVTGNEIEAIFTPQYIDELRRISAHAKSGKNPTYTLDQVKEYARKKRTQTS